MKLQIPDRYLATYRRELVEKQENRIKFLLGMVFFTLLVFVVFGIRPLMKKTGENRKYYAQLSNVDNQLKAKIQFINENMIKIERYAFKVELLDNKIPDKVLLQNYLEEVVRTSSNTGFILQRFLVTEEQSDYAAIDLLFTGTNKNPSQLISVLEDTYRYALINEIKTSLDGETTEVRVNLSIYFKKI